MSLTLTEIVDIAATDTEFIPSMPSDEMYYANQTNERMTDVIATVAAAVLGKADASHAHSGYAATNHTHEPGSIGAALVSHSHYYSDISGMTQALAAKADASALTAKADIIDGKVPSSQLPAFVDDVLEYTALADFPATGESGKIYVAQDTNKTYRWSGSAYVEISASIALGETAATAYRGDRGKTAYDHSQNSTVHVTAAQKTAWDAKADGDHTHTPASIGAAPATHTHDYAASGHTHTPASIGAAAASHSHSGYAASGHTHTASDVGAAAASHTHTPASIGAASASHTHSEYAASNHGHSGYAASGHTHSASDVGALPSSGGTVDGNLVVTGTGTIRGKAYTQQMLPMDAGSYSIGSADNRYYSTYLRVNPNVSSDRRCKRDIAPMDINALAAFVDKLSVVNYNYNDDAADEAKRIGLIAQDVVAADPTIAQGCIEQDEKGFYSLRAADLVFPLIAAVQALTKRVEELEGK